MQHPFPSGFVWGAATAALQIEGAEERGPSVWDAFCQQHPERIHQSATPQVACDHYRRWAEDVDWMQTLGHNGYRMSICWPRVDPRADGHFSQVGLDFYDRLFDALLTRGIQPNVTLYHWDLPSALGETGGWEHPHTIERFLDYSAICFRRYGDRVKLWATLNEPAWTTLNGYVTALHPPCRHDYRAAVLAAQHMLEAHARTVRLYREMGGNGGIGIALNLSTVRPASGTTEDLHAADLADGVLNRWFLEPVLLGRYPSDIHAWYESCKLLPAQAPDLNAPVDWLGVNYYYPHYASADAPQTEFHLNTSGEAADACLFSIGGHFRFVKNRHGRYTDWNWEIDPNGLHSLLLRAHAYRRDLPLYVTENGIGCDDRLQDGTVDDRPRIDFVREHLQSAWQAIQDGVNLRGYYMWSLLDNFSWINGYKKRYGFLHVDRETLKRTPKQSAFWFRDVARANGLR